MLNCQFEDSHRAGMRSDDEIGSVLREDGNIKKIAQSKEELKILKP